MDPSYQTKDGAQTGYGHPAGGYSQPPPAYPQQVQPEFPQHPQPGNPQPGNPQPGYPQPGYPQQGQGAAMYTYPQGNVVVTTAVQPPPGPREPLPCSYIVGVVFAVLSFFLGCWLLAIPAIIFAILGMTSHATNPSSAKTQCLVGMGFTIASFVVSAIIIGVVVVMVINASTNPYGYYR